MKWILNLPGNDFSVYEFTSDSGASFICKHNKAQGSLRLRFQEQHSVFFIDENQLVNRKISLSNAYGSEIALLTKNLWRENTGALVFNGNPEKIQYKIDTHSSTIEITKGTTVINCDLNIIPHPGREEHFITVIIAMSWLQSVNEISQEKVAMQ